MIIDLSGKTALVTGSTAGIGYAIAKGLAASGAEQLFEITHVANIKTPFLGNLHAKTRKLWKRSAGLQPLEAIYLSIKFSSPSVAAPHAPAEMPHCTLFGSPVS
jgi:NAD(P)-dependent dehydrogenase (short-subunit alcohol dehydrogenase family)